jgi:PIN domain nuclease of toxin-antitoxin system
MSSYVLDTHALVWHLAGDPRLGERAREIMQSRGDRLIVPAIVLAEARYIAEAKRVPISFQDVLTAISGDPSCVVAPVDVLTVSYMPMGFDIHDGLIVATALLYRDLLGEDVYIVTRDERIRESHSAPIVW